jgi:hypothetical protein
VNVLELQRPLLELSPATKAITHLTATAVKEGRDLASMSDIQAGRLNACTSATC